MALSSISVLSNTKSKVAKYAIPVLGIAALGGVAYVGYQYLKKDVPPKLDQNPKFPKSDLSQAQAMAIADRLYAAMAQVGTDEAEIFDALNGLTYNDFVKVYDAFGKRQYSLTWGNVGDPLTSSKHHLITWLTNELNADEIKQLEKIIPNLLSVGLGYSATRQVKVVDEFGSPLSKAHVFFSENNGTATNAGGYAFLTGDSEAIVNLSYMGKKTKKFKFGDLPPVVTLNEDFSELPEVVVTAKKKDETPKYLWPAIGATAGLMILMSIGVRT